MSSASSSLGALCDQLQTALSSFNIDAIVSVSQQLHEPTKALIAERAMLLASSPSAEANEAALALLHTLQLLFQCAQQLSALDHTAAVLVVFNAVRGMCTTGSMHRFFTAAAADSLGSQLLYAIVHYLLTCSHRFIDELSQTAHGRLTSPQPTPPAGSKSPIFKELMTCRLYLHPLMLIMRVYPALFHSLVPQLVLLCNRMLSELLALPPSNPHRLLALRECVSSLSGLVNNSTVIILQAPTLPLAAKRDLLDSIFPAFLAGGVEIGAEHAAVLLLSLAQLLQSAPLYPADVVETLFECQLPMLMALLPRAHPYTVLRGNLPPLTSSQNPSTNQNGSSQQKSGESTYVPQLGKLLDECAQAVFTLLTTLLAPPNPTPKPEPHTLSQPTPPTPPASQPASSHYHSAVRSFLWRHVLCPEPPIVSRLAAIVVMKGVMQWGTVFRVQVVQVGLHVLRCVGEGRSLEELWRLKGVEAASDLLSATFPLLSVSEQQMLWGSLGVVDSITRLAADCDVIVAFDTPPSSRSISSSQSSSQSLTPTQPLSASPPSSQSHRPGSAIPLCLAVRLLQRTHLSALHPSTQDVVAGGVVRLLVVYVQWFVGAQRVRAVEELSLLLWTFNLLEWVLASPAAFSRMLTALQQRDLMVKVAVALSSLLRVGDPTFFSATQDAVQQHAMTVTTFMERLQDCSPLLQQRLLLAVLGLLDTPCMEELTAAQLLRALQGVTVIAEQWPSIRWRIPPILLRVCSLPSMRSASTAPDSPSSRLMTALVGLWGTLLERPPSKSTSVTDVLCFDAAISHLFESTSRLAATPFKSVAPTLLPALDRAEILQQLKLWQSTTTTPQPHTPSDEQWTLLHSQRQPLLDQLAQAEQEAQQQQQQAVGGGWLGGAGRNGVKEEEVRMEVAGGAGGGKSSYVLKLDELMRHNVRSREIARVLLDARTGITDDEWRRAKATLQADEAEWMSLFNAIDAAI